MTDVIVGMLGDGQCGVEWNVQNFGYLGTGFPHREMWNELILAILDMRYTSGEEMCNELNKLEN